MFKITLSYSKVLEFCYHMIFYRKLDKMLQAEFRVTLYTGLSFEVHGT